MSAERAQRYTSVAVFLHWAIALLIIAQIAGGLWMTRGEGAITPGDPRFTVFQLHKSLGLTVLLLSVARIVWRLMNPPPPEPAHISAIEKLAAKAAHLLFYVLIFVLPLTGWAVVSTSSTGLPTHFFWLVDWPHLPLPRGGEPHEIFEESHELLAYGAIALIGLHVAGALKHQILDKTDLIGRMAPGLFGPTDPPRQNGRGLVVAVAAPLVLGLGVIAAGMTMNASPAPAQSAAGAEEAAQGEWAWAIDRAASSIRFTGEQSGAAFEGEFRDWSASIVFNPDDLGSARLRAVTAVGSAVTGDSFVDEAMPTGSWFDARNHPEAVFEASSVRATGAGAYEAAGELTIKGATVPVTLPFTLEIDGNAARAEGQVTLDRRAFGLGTDDEDNDGAVSGEIEVFITVVAARG
jgi:cytochrome b561